MSRYTLLTGATGLLGSHVLGGLLRRQERVAVIASKLNGQSVRQQVENIVQECEQHLEEFLPRPLYIDGCGTATRMGLTASDFTWIRRNADRLIDTEDGSTYTSDGKLRRASTMLEACEHGGIGDVHFVSSAFVSGTRGGRVLESELDTGQTFRDADEERLFEAEKLVRSADFIKRLTVYRPSTIVGASPTVPSTPTRFNALVSGVAALVKCVGSRSVPQPDTLLPHVHDANLNLVPVEWVANTICHAQANPAAVGKTYHLVAPSPTSVGKVIATVAARMKRESVADSSVENKFDEQTLRDQIAQYVDALTSFASYDTTNLCSLERVQSCPSIDETIVARCLDLSRRNDQTASKFVPAWSDAIVSAARRDAIDALIEGMGATRARTLGLNVIGPGGGHWTLDRFADRLLTITPGLPLHSRRIVTLTTDELLRLLESPERHAA